MALFIPTNCELVEITNSPSDVIIGNASQDGFFISPPVDFSGVDMFSYSLSIPDTCCPMTCEIHDVFILGPSSIESIDNDISIFPNPAKDLLYIQTSNLSEYSVYITDLLGHQVIESQVPMNTIDVSELSSGVYFLSIYSDEKKHVQKISIE